jgi:hypothetical protein
LAAQFTPQRYRLAFDDAVMGSAQKHPLCDLLLNLQLCELSQKLLFFLLAGFLFGFHALTPRAKYIL